MKPKGPRARHPVMSPLRPPLNRESTTLTIDSDDGSDDGYEVIG